MKDFKSTNTGAIVKISVASFAESMSLKNAIAREIANKGLELKDLKLDIKIEELLNLEIDGSILEKVGPLVDRLIPPLLALDSSPEVNEALMRCMNRCLYNNARITPETFEPEQAREDYYSIAIEVLKANLAPFFKGLLSKLPDRTQKQSQTSASPPPA